jgi:hypothetical protein
MKATYVGPLTKPTACGTYVSFTVSVGLPTTGIAKDLPPLPEGHQETWTLYVTKRQWDRVAHAFRMNREERAIAEGIAVCRADGLYLWVTALKALSMEKARSAQQKAAVQA